jgi:hypothetical protein
MSRIVTYIHTHPQVIHPTRSSECDGHTYSLTETLYSCILFCFDANRRPGTRCTG